MKYPFVIFYRDDKVNYIDKFFITNSEKLCCTIFIANSLENIKNLYNCNFHILINFCNALDDKILKVISKDMLVRCIDANIVDNIDTFNKIVNEKYIYLCAINRTLIRPIFSVFTSSFNSFDKILRVYNSLMNQTLLNWEWVIVDDSTDDNNFEFLKSKFNSEPRIRLFKRSKNNGSIGNVKNEAIGLCRGKYLLEMDHDDELLPYVLQDATDVFDKQHDVGFVYMDCACLYENGNNQWFGDFICKGYGGYYSQKYNDKWLLVYITPNINNVTMSHLVCCPNHPRIWRKDVLLDIGSYCELLPICDDYEILLRTFLNTKVAKIHRLGYIQYMNNENNNFSLIRNSEINRIGPQYISPIYFNIFKVNQKMKENNAYDDEAYIYNSSKIWERNPKTYIYNYCNYIINPIYKHQICIISLDSLYYYLNDIHKLYLDTENDFILLENKCNLEYIWQRLENLNLNRFKCYTLIDTSNELLINYFNLLYKSCEKVTIFNIEIERPAYNTNYDERNKVINSLTDSNNNYLEIGIEYGQTITNVHFKNRTGVDPDPKLDKKYANEMQIYNYTSDVYFEKLNEMNETRPQNIIYDVIFIDGMHQVEYFIRDLNNSIQYLSIDGTIFIDDIIPLNYNEQLKIPIKHYYENNILKYNENWTGDIWKVVYYMLLNFINKIKKFQYFYNINYRGVAMIKFEDKFIININEQLIQMINNYDYFTEFPKYLQLLDDYSNKN